MANKVEVTADPEKIREYEALKRELGRRKAERPSRWYCGRKGCDGEPHEGMWFCDHAAPHPVGPEYWRCRHARADQCPPKGDWHVWLLMSGRGFGKMLDLSTPIPTPAGWSKMGEIAVDDEVFDESGRVCRVTAVFDGMPDTAYRLTFSDGTSLEACGDHQWVTWTHAERKAFLRSSYEDTSTFPAEWPAWRLKRLLGPGRYAPSLLAEARVLLESGLSMRKTALRLGVCRQSLSRQLTTAPREAKVYPDSPGPRIRTTSEIVRTLHIGKREDTNHSIPTCLSLDLPEAELPIDPYVLGYWLGDGTSRDGTFTCALSDQPNLYAALVDYSPHSTPGSKDGMRVSTYGLHAKLRALGVLCDKHVPAAYLRGSARQRLDLLRGLMDSDGYAGGASVEFCSTLRVLADAVAELATSLGQKPILSESRATLDGRDCGPKFRVTWRPTVDVFRLERKLAAVNPAGAQSLRNHHRMIVSAEEIPLRPMRCITVDSKHSMYLAGDGMIPTHNTRSGAEWLAYGALHSPGTVWAAVAPTRDDLRATCIEGESGLLAALGMTRGDDNYDKSNLQIRLPNGSLIRGLSAERPERTRGPNLAGMWADELCVWRYPSIWNDLTPALRRGEARIVVSTTPRPTALIRTLVEDETTVVTRGSTFDNEANLSTVVLSKLRQSWEGTRLSRQELFGELLTDTPGAVFNAEWIERGRGELLAA